MRYTAAYLLAVLGGNSSPDVADMAKILGSVGIECDEIRAQKVVDACKGRDVNEIIANGMTKIDAVSANTPVETSGPIKIKTPPLEPSPPSTPPESRPGSPTFMGLFD